MAQKINYIKVENDKHKKEFSRVLSQIKRYKKIAVFRHIMPDFDALGTQYGLATWIKENFPEKDVKILGDNHVTFMPRGLFPETDKVNDSWFKDRDFLAIIVDVGDKKRIADPRFEKAKYKIKIDHHPVTDEIFNLAITDTSKAAASEIVANMLISFKNYNLSELAARYLYIALVGDSGRFQYSSTTPHTFEIASELISKGINITNVYALMYEKNVDDLEVTKFILNNYKLSPEGVAYYVLTQKDLDNLGLTCERGKENVNLFSNIKGIKIWCSITEDVTEPCFRISIRTRDYVINGVASEFKGGGHAQASGCQIKDLTELPNFIDRLDELIKTGK